MALIFYRMKAPSGNRGALHVKFAATHKEAAPGVAANKAALMVFEF
jgi:hypothetical protein